MEKTSPMKEKFPLDKKQLKSDSGSIFYQKGLIGFEFIPEGQSVNKKLNIEFLDSY